MSTVPIDLSILDSSDLNLLKELCSQYIKYKKTGIVDEHNGVILNMPEGFVVDQLSYLQTYLENQKSKFVIGWFSSNKTDFGFRVHTSDPGVTFVSKVLNSITRSPSQIEKEHNNLIGYKVKFTNDFRVGIWSEPFNESQALAIKYLWEQHQKGIPEVHEDEILSHTFTAYKRMQDLFRVPTKNDSKVLHPLFHEIFTYRNCFYALKQRGF